MASEAEHHENLPSNEIVEWVDYDKTSYYTRLYKVENNQPKALLFLIHGFGEHSDRYEVMARSFVEKGIQVFTFDLKGFGRTGRRGGQLGSLGTYASTFKTIEFFINKHKIEGVPNFIYGHSMGGGIVLNFCADKQASKDIKGVIASAPALMMDPKKHYPGFVLSILNGLVALFPSIPMTIALDDTKITSNVEELEKYRKSFYNFGKTTIQTASQLVSQGEDCMLNKSKTYSVPVLVVHGRTEQVTMSAGSQKFFNNLPENLDKRLELFESGYHELHFEPDFKDKVTRLYTEWILEHV